MSEAARVPGMPYHPKKKPSAPAVPPPPAPGVSADENPPRLYHFTHSVDELPVTLSVVVNARTEQDARGAAYLLAEDFCRRIIGQLRAE